MIGHKLSHYVIIEVIGAGGMGVVYRAHDERLHRDVALKVLPPGVLADTASRNRFRREALALSRLNHPNIETVHDFDTQGDVDFLVLELVVGATLAERLQTGPIPEREAVRLGAQLAEGLAAAHRQGILHRDIKPDNLRVTADGQLKVLDFGLAKLVRVGGEEATETQTETGRVAGTLPYMAPEQLLADRVDERTDLWAVGAVLYEMATGQRPFREEVPSRLTDAILHQSPPNPRALSPRLSSELERIVLKCLEKDPEGRYQSAKELVVDLRRLASPSDATVFEAPGRKPPRGRRLFLPAAAVGVVLIVGLIGLRLGGWWPWTGRTAGAGEIRSLAVLPLENLSGNAEQEYFVDGMTEELTTRLAQIGSLRVIARTSAMRFKGARESVAKIGKDLNVDAIVEGSVLRSGDRVRITAQLVRTATEGHLWAQSYDRALVDVLSLQSEVAQAIAREIQVELTPGERERLARHGPVDPAAHEAYLRGLYLWNQRTAETIERSIGFFQEAIARDSSYALAYAGLASACGILPAYRDVPSRQIVPKMREAALKALKLDPSLGEAHANLANIKGDFDYDPTGAEEEHRRAIELAPNNATVHQWYGEFLAHLGRQREAMAEFERATELDPLSPIASAMIADAHYLARQYDLAIASARRTIEMFPDFKRVHVFLANAYLAQGKYEEAMTEIEAARGSGSQKEVRAAFRASGARGYWKKLLQLRLERRKAVYVYPVAIAVPYAQLGERDQALSWLERDYEDRNLQLAYYLSSPLLDSLRGDPRFGDLLRRVGLAH